MIHGLKKEFPFILILILLFNLLTIIPFTLGVNSIVYIREDGTIDPVDAPIIKLGEDLFVLTDNMDASLIIEKDDITLNGSGYIIAGANSKYISISGRNNVTLINLVLGTLEGYYIGDSGGPRIEITNSKNMKIIKSKIYAGYLECIKILSSTDILFSQNIMGYMSDCTALSLKSSSKVKIIDNQLGFPYVGDTDRVIFSDSCSEIQIIKNTMRASNDIYMRDTSNSLILGNYIYANRGNGIILLRCEKITLSHNIVNLGYPYTMSLDMRNSNNNIITDNILHDFIVIYDSHSNKILRNSIGDSEKWIEIVDSSDNVFYHNNFWGGASYDNENVPSQYNVWDNGYPSGGNYWRDYYGPDLYSGPNQDTPGSDGIGDIPFLIDARSPGLNQDNYPLLEPWTPTIQADIAITLLSSSYDPVLDEHYFEYMVECLSGHGVSHITFEMDGNCNPDVDDGVLVDAGWVSGIPLQDDSPEIIGSGHPKAPPTGIKYDFDPSIEPREHSTIYFSLKGEWVPDGTIPVHVKAGKDTVTIISEGPDCKGTSSEDTGEIIVRKVVDLGLQSEYMNDIDFEFCGGLGVFYLSDCEEECFIVSPGLYPVYEDNIGWSTELKLYINGVFQSKSSSHTITVDVQAGNTYTLVFINKPPDFVIPETSWGVIGALLTMLAALVVSSNRRIR